MPDVPVPDDSARTPRRAAVGDPAGTAATSGTARRTSARTVTPPAGMGAAAAWTVLGTVLPGLGLWRAGRRVAGSLVLAVAVLLIAGLAGVALTQRTSLVSFATDPQVLRWVAVALAVVALAWLVVIGATHLALRPADATPGQRIAGAALVAGLSFAVAAPLALGANAAFTTSRLLENVFGDDNNPSQTVPTITNSADPWAGKDRLNILIPAGDSGTGRDAKLGMRTDAVIVASIDTHSGATTLFSLPRQTARMPFPKDSELAKYFPNGWYDGHNPVNPDYWLSAMYRFAPTMVDKEVLGPTKYLAEDIMKISVGEALGLDIDYFITLDMDGFKDIINALGGVTLNVNSPLPIGGNTDRNILPTGWIEPGPNQHFGGRLALWYARGRWGYLDYDRMARQRCVVNAVVQQANPQNVLLNLEKLATAGEKTITTDIPDTMVGPMLELATRMQDTKLRSVAFVHNEDGFSTTDPNWATVRKQVKKALKESGKSNPAPTSTPRPDGSSSAKPTKPTESAKPTKSTKPRSDDLDDACGYHPTGFIPKGYPATRDNPHP